MPFRCTKCQHISNEDDFKECPTRDKCYFERVAMIHYASPNGTGAKVGVTRVTVKNLDTEEVMVGQEVKLHCNSEATPRSFTSAPSAATCPDCLTTIKKDE